MGVFVTAAYTALIVCSNRYVKAQSNLLPPGYDYNALSPEDLVRRRYGSKMVVVVEQTHIAVIWACKACLLIMYHRLTRTALRNENIAIRLLSAYVALGFIAMEVLYFTAWCRPISEYWAVPTSSRQCNALINHRITKAVFNLSSDVIMLVIALQMLLRSLLPLKRKLILCGIFSLGIFVIIASVLNSYYSLKSPYKPTWISWYVRESSTAILVANLPFTWTILREMFDLGTFDESGPPPWTFHSARTAQGRRSMQTHNRLANSHTGSRQKPSPLSTGSQGTRAMTLVDSLSPLRPTLKLCSQRSSIPQSELDMDDVEKKDRSYSFASTSSPYGHLGTFHFDFDSELADQATRSPSSPRASYQLRLHTTEDEAPGLRSKEQDISTPLRAFFARLDREQA